MISQYVKQGYNLVTRLNHVPPINPFGSEPCSESTRLKKSSKAKLKNKSRSRESLYSVIRLNTIEL